ncbi:[protein release factor]-glutamine N5-methyltransferase [Halopseudomonas xinjiangensis]|uniref:Release factor glutamine methyltransferase n=1 Tax=Halopseudomonas xinjiangensis TaxID=487184 RepID=A0A1H1W069_9GAMM|nr:peptide chain release factor N(5)-glutamine methyltransferase [Halopseudomonas xinjiangensis]SDS90385.1 [protein release factor]-glutamine N5-methyltransferase [Halopseudomonas xinjiangensis]
MSATVTALLAQVELPDSSSPRLDAELLLAHVLNKPRSFLRTWPEHALKPDELQRYSQLVTRRRAGEPVAYLLGRQGFWNLDLEVAPSTLIPRADTETLVEAALDLALPAEATVLDLGTGTGAIALALAGERPGWQVLGCDRVDDAVQLATSNARRLGARNARFVLSDWFGALDPSARFNLVVSNPPYIAENDEHLGQGDVRFEPASALVSGPDGLDDIRRIIGQAPAFLSASGWLLLEHGWDQAESVASLLDSRGFQSIFSRRDIGGHQRVTGGYWHAG